jgi:hypothetical protein
MLTKDAFAVICGSLHEHFGMNLPLALALAWASTIMLGSDTVDDITDMIELFVLVGQYGSLVIPIPKWKICPPSARTFMS